MRPELGKKVWHDSDVRKGHLEGIAANIILILPEVFNLLANICVPARAWKRAR